MRAFIITALSWRSRLEIIHQILFLTSGHPELNKIPAAANAPRERTLRQTFLLFLLLMLKDRSNLLIRACHHSLISLSPYVEGRAFPSEDHLLVSLLDY
jgi:hypothetical protein